MLNLNEVLSSISSATVSELQKLQKAVNGELSDREKYKANCVEYCQNVCDDDLLDEVWSDCESLGLLDSKRKTDSQWLRTENEPYTYHDTNPVHNAKDITTFPGLYKLLQQINADQRFTGPLDSCLVLKYSCTSASLSPHADDEECIDQEKSICNFSIGSRRTLEFYNKYGKSKHVKSVLMESNSITHMKPGCQQLLKHQVRAETNTRVSVDEVRYSISFRSLVVKGGPSLNQMPSSESDCELKGLPVTDSVIKKPVINKPAAKTHIALVAGDSYAARLDTSRLGRNSICVECCSG